MDTQEIKKQLQLQDRAVSILSNDGFYRATAVKTSTLSKTAQISHSLNGNNALLLADFLSGAALFSSFLKGEERIILDISGKGKLSKINTEAMQNGECRGFIDADLSTFDYANHNLRDLTQSGIMKVIKILYDKNEPIMGIVELINGDVATNLEHYFNQSEQVKSSIIVDSSLDSTGSIQQSGAIILQAMPGADPKVTEKYFAEFKECERITALLEKQYRPDEIMKIMLPFEFSVLKSKRYDFFCRCSKERMLDALISLGIDEIKDMKEKQDSQLKCRYCSKEYILDDKDFDMMIATINSKLN